MTARATVIPIDIFLPNLPEFFADPQARPMVGRS